MKMALMEDGEFDEESEVMKKKMRKNFILPSMKKSSLFEGDEKKIKSAYPLKKTHSEGKIIKSHSFLRNLSEKK